MSESLHEEEYKGCTIRISRDDSPESPREWCNVGTMVCWSDRYTLGDEQPTCDRFNYLRSRIDDRVWTEELLRRRALVSEDFEPEDRQWRIDHEIENEMEDDAALCLSLFEKTHIILGVYPNPQADMSSGTFDFEDGNVGFIYCTLAQAQKEWPTPDFREKARAYLEGEVETYSSYLEHDVAGYEALDPKGEVIDSCWGFYPDDREGWSKRWDYPISQARDAIDHWLEQQHEQETSSTACHI